MAIALTPFQALCGFRSPGDILDHFDKYPELVAIITDSASKDFQTTISAREASEGSQRQAYKNLFFNFMSQSDEVANTQVEVLISRLKSTLTRSSLDNVILQLNTDYPNDRGIFCPLILNYLELKPGDSFFMGPNEPHAYLSGDCIECMALSDNVVRAGLTPKFKDVDTLCKMLHYRNGSPARLEPSIIDAATRVYRPPSSLCAEFEVEEIIIEADALSSIRTLPCASILLVVEGSDLVKLRSIEGSLEASPGSVIFLAAGLEASVESTSPTKIYRAHVNLNDII